MRRAAVLFVLLILFLCESTASAGNGWQGCCSWHGGISGICRQGRMMCNDGTLSPSCTCEDQDDYRYQRPRTQRRPAPSVPRPVSFAAACWTGRADAPVDRSSMTLKTLCRLNDNGTAPFTLRISNRSTAPYSGFVKINGVEYGICTSVGIPFEYYSKNADTKLFFSVDGGKAVELIVDRIVLNKGYVTFDFRANDFVKFHYALRRGNVIRFQVENNTGYSWVEYPLSGFSYVYDRSTDYMAGAR